MEDSLTDLKTHPNVATFTSIYASFLASAWTKVGGPKIYTSTNTGWNTLLKDLPVGHPAFSYYTRSMVYKGHAIRDKI